MIEQMHVTTQDDEPAADAPDRSAVVAVKVGDRLKVRLEATGQPDEFDFARTRAPDGATTGSG